MGDIPTMFAPEYNPTNTEMRPMSWKCGTHVTTTDSSLVSVASMIAVMLLVKLPWVTTTPFGSPVEPDVY
jgi:hypothetical protein